MIKGHLCGTRAHYGRPQRSEQPRWLAPCGTRPLKRRTVVGLQPPSPAAPPPFGHVSVPQMQLPLRLHQGSLLRRALAEPPPDFC